MTIICKHCGCENHLDSDICVECGQPIQKNEAYVVCNTCGISNPKSASKCIGCGEHLDTKHSFQVEERAEDEKKLEKKRIPKEKSTIPKGYVVIGVLGGVSVLLVTLIIMLFNTNTYYESEIGQYFISETGILHVLSNGKNLEVGYDVQNIDAIQKYGRFVYYLADGNLNVFNGKMTRTIASSVIDFKVNSKGDQVLYLVTNTEITHGDLYLFDGKESLRVDGNVGVGRYIFGSKRELYYVKDITVDENLGVMYLKSGNEPAIQIAEDVFMPLFSLKKESIYYSRQNINDVDRFDLFYKRNNKVTEVKRNVSQIHYHSSDESFILVQYKNSREYLYEIYRDESTFIQGEFLSSGIYQFGDTNKIQLTVSPRLILKDEQGKNWLFEKELNEIGDFDNFWLSLENEKIYTLKDDELFVSDLNNGLENTRSLERNGSIYYISRTGQSAIIEVGDVLKYYNNGSYDVLSYPVDSITLSENEKFMIYMTSDDAYVLKIGAKEPVFLGSEVEEVCNEGIYVYTRTKDELFRYTLGKFSSNTSISKFRSWGKLD